MTIRLHQNLKYSQPFSIAECSLNCPQDLRDLFYGKADRLMDEYEQKFAEKLGYKNISHWKEDGNTPSDYMELVNLAIPQINEKIDNIRGIELGMWSEGLNVAGTSDIPALSLTGVACIPLASNTSSFCLSMPCISTSG